MNRESTSVRTARTTSASPIMNSVTNVQERRINFGKGDSLNFVHRGRNLKVQCKECTFGSFGNLYWGQRPLRTYLEPRVWRALNGTGRGGLGPCLRSRLFNSVRLRSLRFGDKRGGAGGLPGCTRGPRPRKSSPGLRASGPSTAPPRPDPRPSGPSAAPHPHRPGPRPRPRPVGSRARSGLPAAASRPSARCLRGGRTQTCSPGRGPGAHRLVARIARLSRRSWETPAAHRQRAGRGAAAREEGVAALRPPSPPPPPTRLLGRPPERPVHSPGPPGDPADAAARENTTSRASSDPRHAPQTPRTATQAPPPPRALVATPTAPRERREDPRPRGRPTGDDSPGPLVSPGPAADARNASRLDPETAPDARRGAPSAKCSRADPMRRRKGHGAEINVASLAVRAASGETASGRRLSRRLHPPPGLGPAQPVAAEGTRGGRHAPP